MNRAVDLDRLSPRERLELVQELWDQLAEEPEQVPVTPAQQHELDRRLAEHIDGRLVRVEGLLDGVEILVRTKPGS